jgi:uncharacterized protein
MSAGAAHRDALATGKRAATRSRLARATLAAGLIFLAAGALSGLWLDERGGVLDAVEWVLRTLVVLAAFVFVVGSLGLALRARRLSKRRPVGWLLAMAAFAGVTWLVAIPVGYGVYVSHLPSRRAITDVNLGAPKLPVTLPGANGVKLRGWYVPSRNGAAVIAIHGTGGSRLSVSRHAHMLVRHGYGVLALDMRGHGESEGRSTSAPWTMEKDIAGALRWLAGRRDVDPDRLALLGVSMGAEVAVRVAPRHPAARAVVAEGLNGGEKDAADAGLSWPAVAQVYALGAVTHVLLGQGIGSDADLVERMNGRPLLLISGGRGSEADVNRLFLRRTRGGAEHWNLPNGAHASAMSEQPRVYERRVIGFLQRALGS